MMSNKSTNKPEDDSALTSAELESLGLATLEKEYQALTPVTKNFVIELNRQIEEVLSQKKITLGVPIQSRTKNWKSIAEKIDRKSLNIGSVKELPDLIGLRLILLFDRDVKTTCELLENTFKVISKENTQERLGEAQFGYSSVHYIIEVPKAWLAVPTLSKLHGLHAEIQVRTIAQHIWAAASHTLQYKQESNVPPPIRRAIHRVSALLETVDLELERVLEQRDDYKKSEPRDSDQEINVDLLERFLDENLPIENKSSDSDYSDLLNDLNKFGINTIKQLHNLWSKWQKDVLIEEHEMWESRRETLKGTSKERSDAGVFYTFGGLIRSCLLNEFGEEWTNYNANVKNRIGSV